MNVQGEGLVLLDGSAQKSLSLLFGDIGTSQDTEELCLSIINVKCLFNTWDWLKSWNFASVGVSVKTLEQL